jgi:hypothetical protein
VRRRILEERLIAAPCHPASRTAKRRPDGIRCGATLISSQPPPCPTTRAHGCIWSTPRSTARRVWRGRRALPTSPRESRSCPARGCPPRRKPMTGWCTWSRTPAMIPPRSMSIRSLSVKARRIWSWPPMPTPSRSAAIRGGGSPTRGSDTASRWWTRPSNRWASRPPRRSRRRGR